jgi:hypothetical protein
MEQLSLKDVIANKQELIALKKANAKKFTDAVSFDITENKTVIKAEPNGLEDTENVIYRTIVGNTYNWMDSHDDVHINGLFGKSISENKTKILHLHDHLYRLTAKVGKPLDIYEKELNWTDLGVAKPGNTMALMMDSEIKKALNNQIFDFYKEGEINQHSVGMSYVKIFLAINSEKEKEEFATWNKYFNMIGNKERALEKGYFWAVTEAKLFEISAVISGSNELTPTIEPIKFTPMEEPKNKELDYEYLINNIKINGK